MSNLQERTAQAGITLVALVVTIVVLLILAGITLTYVLGDNGIFELAKLAKEETRAGKVQEEVSIWKIEKIMDSYRVEKAKQRDELIDDQQKRELLTPEEAETAKSTGKVKIASQTIDYGEMEEEEIPWKWIYHENTDGNIEITGVDLREYFNSTPKNRYRQEVILGTEEFIIPSTLDGKKVVSVCFKDSPNNGNFDGTVSNNRGVLVITDVKRLIIGDSIERVGDVDSPAEPFPNGYLAFSGIESIHYPTKLKVLYDALLASGDQKGLKLYIPEETEIIQNRALDLCYNVEVVIPKSAKLLNYNQEVDFRWSGQGVGFDGGYVFGDEERKTCIMSFPNGYNEALNDEFSKGTIPFGAGKIFIKGEEFIP